MSAADSDDALPQATAVPPRARAVLDRLDRADRRGAGRAGHRGGARAERRARRSRVVFKSADGIEAGKTFVKYKDVNIGQVTAVRLTDDFAKVEVTARIAKSAAGLMVEDAKFWVVRRASA